MDENQTNEEQKQKSSNMPMAIIVIAVVALLGIGGVAYKTMNASSTSEKMEVVPTGSAINTFEPTSVVEDTATAPGTQMTAGSYKNGEYQVVGTYVSPGGPEEIGVTVTLTDGVISEVAVEPKATKPKSVQMQGVFAANYKELVVGKKLDEVKLDKVSGSSLTPKGFNDALEKIKVEAKA